MDTNSMFSLDDIKPAGEIEAKIVNQEDSGDQLENNNSNNNEASSSAGLENNQNNQEDLLDTGNKEKIVQSDELAFNLNPDNVKTDTPSSEENDGSSFSVFAKYLKEEGVLSNDVFSEENPEIKTADDLKKLFQKQIELSRYSDLTDTQRRYLDSIESGIPQSELELIEDDLSSLSSIDEDLLKEDIQLRFDIIVTDLIETGLSKERAEKIAQQSVDAEEDVEDAKTAKENLIARRKEDYKSKVSVAKEERKSSLKEVEDFVFAKKDKLLNAIEIDDSQKKKIYDLMVSQVDVTETGTPVNAFAKWRMENGLEAELILNALYLHTDGFKSLGTVQSIATGNSAKNLEKVLRSNETKDILDSMNSGTSNRNKLTLL